MVQWIGTIGKQGGRKGTGSLRRCWGGVLGAFWVLLQQEESVCWGKENQVLGSFQNTYQNAVVVGRSVCHSLRGDGAKPRAKLHSRLQAAGRLQTRS